MGSSSRPFFNSEADRPKDGLPTEHLGVGSDDTGSDELPGLLPGSQWSSLVVFPKDLFFEMKSGRQLGSKYATDELLAAGVLGGKL